VFPLLERAHSRRLTSRSRDGSATLQLRLIGTADGSAVRTATRDAGQPGQIRAAPKGTRADARTHAGASDVVLAGGWNRNAVSLGPELRLIRHALLPGSAHEAVRDPRALGRVHTATGVTRAFGVDGGDHSRVARGHGDLAGHLGGVAVEAGHATAGDAGHRVRGQLLGLTLAL